MQTEHELIRVNELGKEIRVKFGKYCIIMFELGLEVIKILIAQWKNVIFQIIDSFLF